ncbi:GspE/PulE family protein [Haloimpatiens lingqiaonensis]|uniref:GspE/PulE family protein n=1 Tax=Haloimpatiens lingqiaonensis TaxID=1380675 RepID=UPI0010FE668B|nr:GspE/PulE family protein [Haloimpatiens lingqiaonensis]
MVVIKEHNLDIFNLKLNMDVLTKISRSAANKFCILPFNIEDYKVCVLASKELNESAIDYIKFIYKMDLKIYLVEKKQLSMVIEKYHKKIILQGAIKEIEKSNGLDENIQGIENSKEVENAPAVKIANTIINEAISMRASDIHIEPFQDYVIVRFRIDGALIVYTELSKRVYSFLVCRIKIMANMDISKKFMPADGKIYYKLEENRYDLRVSTLPTVYGEKVVIRILHKEGGEISLDSLGFKEESYKLIKKCIEKPNGMILVVGPTGSGKSTTLYSLLKELNQKQYNITTIEDPVEYNMPFVNQININNKVGLTFAQGLRSILRQDPDVIMVGEIRDSETAKIAVKAAMTGHLVFSTLHTKDSSGTILRLMDMGVENYLLADTLLAVISQRLVRKICNYCKESYKPSEEEKRVLNLNEEQLLFRGKGCAYCNNTGYSSRTVLYEILVIGDKEREFIRNINSIDEKSHKYNFYVGKSLKERAIELVKMSTTTYEEIVKHII